MYPAAEPPPRTNTVLRFVAGMAVILALLLAGNVIATVARLPLPGSVVGMLLLAGGLRVRLISPDLVQPAADLLIRNMALLFVPAGVGLMLYLPLLQREWIPIAAAGAASTVAVLVAVAWLQQRLERND